MEELTIKVNKSVFFGVAGLILGVALGFGGASLSNKTQAAPQGNNPQVVQADPQGQAPQPTVQQPITITESDHMQGASNPKLILVEFSDFECPFCAKIHPTLTRILNENKDKIAWVYRHYPLDFHENAQLAAEASECAGEQGAFWGYAERIFNGSGVTRAQLEQYAQNLGLYVDGFKSCLDSGRYTEKVKSDLASGMGAGVNGTPATIMIKKDGTQEIISGALPYEQIKLMVEAAL